jgi:hypothetical protein
LKAENTIASQSFCHFARWSNFKNMFCPLEVVPSVRLAVVRFLSIPELIITWAIEKLLDFILKHAVKSTRKFLRQHRRYDFYDILLRINQAFLIHFIPSYVQDTRYATRYPMICFAFESLLITHRRMHKRGLVKMAHSCPTCQYILKQRSSFEQCISEPILYPPYEFVKGEHYARKFPWRSGAILQEASE